MNTRSSIFIGISLILGMFLLGYMLGESIVKFKSFERYVLVKGFAQKEVEADMVLWPIQYLHAENDLATLYSKFESDASKIEAFLKKAGFNQNEMSLNAPVITDKMAQAYGQTNQMKYRYSGVQTLTVYTKQVAKARNSMKEIAALGKSGITFRSESYENKTQYIYSELNEIKPMMIEEATRNARASAIKFAEDSQSSLGKIKSANQGQFSITPRDQFTSHIKKVRVVSTVEYYLID